MEKLIKFRTLKDYCCLTFTELVDEKIVYYCSYTREEPLCIKENCHVWKKLKEVK